MNRFKLMVAGIALIALLAASHAKATAQSPILTVTNVQKAQVISQYATGVQGGGHLVLTKEMKTGNSVTSALNVSYSVVSLAVGFDVSQSVTWTYTDAKDVPRGKTGRIDAYNVYQLSTYDIWGTATNILGRPVGRPQKVGAGTAYKFLRVEYRYSQW